MFLCSQPNAQEYADWTIAGKTEARHSSVLICGIARNIDRVLPYTIARLERLGELFAACKYFVFENDSKDDTLEILQDWAIDNDTVTIKHDQFNPPPFTDPHGYDRRFYMAKARNIYLEYARRFIREHITDYVIVVDMDLYGGWSYHGVLNSLGQKHKWDVVGSNSLCYIQHNKEWCKLFYDSWAFRPLDHPEAIDDQEANLFVFNRGEPLVPVNSVFGGLAIYKPRCIQEGLNYTADDCDHPTLHNALRQRNYRIMLNPSQITLYNKTVYTI